MRTAALALLLLLAVVAAYAPALEGAFVDFDDDVYVTDNEPVRAGLSLAGLRWALTTGHAANWHPLTWLSHQIDCQLWGLDPWGHHLTNLLLHAANTLLLFGWLASTTRRPVLGAWVAALFALHPLRVESVAWVAERKDLLSALFGLLSLWAYSSYARTGSVRRYVAAWLLLALGLTAKPMLVTLPFVYLLLDVWPLKRTKAGARRLVLEKLPFLALSVASSVVTFFVQRGWGAVSTAETVPLAARAANAAVSYVRYLLYMVWPADLALLYPHPALPGGRPWGAGVVAGATLFLVAFTVLLVWARRRRYLLVGWLWYLGMLVPVIGLVQVGAQAMADRYTYLPSIGLAILVVWGLDALVEHASDARLRWALSVAGLLVLAALVVATRAQTRHWQDSVSLYRRSIAATGGSAIQHNNLGAALERVGSDDEALSHYRRSLEIDPAAGGAHENLSRLLLARGAVDEARREARLAVELQPDRAEAHATLGNALAAARRHEDALRAFRHAVELDPNDADLRYNLANTLADLGRSEEAARAYADALELRPGFAAAHNNLGNLLLTQGRAPEAAEQFRRALEGEPDLAEAHYGLGAALARTGQPVQALAAFERASRLQADWAAPLTARAWILATHPDETIRDGALAVALAQAAVRASGERDTRALDTLGAALAETGRFAAAAAAARRAVRLAEETGDARLAARIGERVRLYQAARPYRSGRAG